MSGKRELLVLHAAPDELRLAHFRRVGAIVELTEASNFFCKQNTSESQILADQTVLDALEAFIADRGWKGSEVYCLLNGSNSVCHYFEMPPLTGKALEQAARLKLAQQVHFDVSQSLVDVQVVGQVERPAGKQSFVAITAIPDATAQLVVTATERVGLRLTGLSAYPAALTALALDGSDATSQARAFLHLDETRANFIVLVGARAVVNTELPIGLADLTAALQRPIIVGEDVLQLDAERATALRNEIGIPTAGDMIPSLNISGERLVPLLEPTLQKWSKLLTQWLTFASTSGGAGTINSIKLVGPGSRISGIAQSLAARHSLEVEAASWLVDRVSLAESAAGVCLDEHCGSAAAVLLEDKLPDLIPPSIRQQRKISRIRRTVTLVAPCAAAALAIVAVLFDTVGRGLRHHVETEQKTLGDVQKTLGRNGGWAKERHAVTTVVDRIADFGRHTPSWVGIFKELSMQLPHELHANEYAARARDGRLTMTVSASVHADKADHNITFDQVVGQTLQVLQRSPFFKRVELISANRQPSADDPLAIGLLVIEVDLQYPVTKAKAS